MAGIFARKPSPEATTSPVDVEKLLAKIDQLLVERDFLPDAA